MKAFLHRYWLPVVFFVSGIALLLGGLGTVTIWKPSPTVNAQYQLTEKNHLVVTKPGMLALYAPEVKIKVTGQGQLQAAIARSIDAQQWSKSQNYVQLTGVSADSTFTNTKHEAKAEGEPADGANQALTLANAGGQDMWLVYKQAKDSLELTYTPTTSDQDLLVWAEKTPAKVTLSWKRQVNNGWFVYLEIIGALLLFLGAVIAFFLSRMAKALDEETSRAKVKREQLRKLQAENGPLTDQLPSLKSVTNPPSRKELREAREKGIDSIEIDGVRFPTGFIPKITLDELGNPIKPDSLSGSLAEGGTDSDARNADRANDASSASKKTATDKADKPSLPVPPVGARGKGKWTPVHRPVQDTRGEANATQTAAKAKPTSENRGVVEEELGDKGPNLNIWEDEK